jgi:hypothetical protein
VNVDAMKKIARRIIYKDFDDDHDHDHDDNDDDAV